MKKKCFCFDLDNVICTTKKNFYKKSTPKKKVIKLINKLYINNQIIIFTARGMSKYNENLNLIKKKLKPLTEKQLKNWGVKYHKLIFGKPSYDIYIDDKNYKFKKDWYKSFKL